MDDPDANGFVHWVVVNLPGDDSSMEEGASGSMPDGTIEGSRLAPATSGTSVRARPAGSTRYLFTLYALSEALAVGAQPSELTADTVRGLIEGFVIDESELTGTYSR